MRLVFAAIVVGLTLPLPASAQEVCGAGRDAGIFDAVLDGFRSLSFLGGVHHLPSPETGEVIGVFPIPPQGREDQAISFTRTADDITGTYTGAQIYTVEFTSLPDGGLISEMEDLPEGLVGARDGLELTNVAGYADFADLPQLTGTWRQHDVQDVRVFVTVANPSYIHEVRRFEAGLTRTYMTDTMTDA